MGTFPSDADYLERVIQRLPNGFENVRSAFNFKSRIASFDGAVGKYLHKRVKKALNYISVWMRLV